MDWVLKEWVLTEPARFFGDELLLPQLGWLVWAIGAVVVFRLVRRR
jgi:hypothetical protein